MVTIHLIYPKSLQCIVTIQVTFHPTRNSPCPLTHSSPAFFSNLFHPLAPITSQSAFRVGPQHERTQQNTRTSALVRDPVFAATTLSAQPQPPPAAAAAAAAATISILGILGILLSDISNHSFRHRQVLAHLRTRRSVPCGTIARSPRDSHARIQSSPAIRPGQTR